MTFLASDGIFPGSDEDVAAILRHVPRLRAVYDWATVVHELRTRMSKSQPEFAVAVGCSPSSVSKWERGETVPIPKQRRELERIGREASYPSTEWPRAHDPAPAGGA